MIRGVWSPETVAWVIMAALLPTALVVVLEQGAAAGMRIAVGWGTVIVWQLVFGLLRGQRLYPIGAVTAVAVAVLAPAELAYWQLLLAVTFGTVIGESIFGGWGRNFLSGAVVTLAFLFFSFPDVRHDPVGVAVAVACLPAGAGLIIAGILSWRVVAGAIASLVAVTLLFDKDPSTLVAQGGLVFGLVFLVGDPVAAASTNPGRWVYGALAGALAGIFGWGGAGIDTPQAIVFAALVASIFAPLIDHATIAATSLLGRRRYG